MFSKKEFRLVLWLALALCILLGVKYANAEPVNPAFAKVDIQRVHDDDAAVTCWVLYAPSDKAVRSDSYSISCLPNSVINPKAAKDE
ncbi:hypothetical protein CB293_23255 [Salmonella enterica subsp. enterica serovar Kentucky]|nr:hypothetical protein [Salmonella enterica subsp. enterica serovar Kentucky]